jgi:hypothetical protein
MPQGPLYSSSSPPLGLLCVPSRRVPNQTSKGCRSSKGKVPNLLLVCSPPVLFWLL